MAELRNHEVSKGVLHGDSISPLLVAIFIDDIESFMQHNHCSAVEIDHFNGLLSHFYTLMTWYYYLIRQWDFKKNYHKLGIKSKIIIFKKDSDNVTKGTLYYSKEKIEAVDSFK